MKPFLIFIACLVGLDTVAQTGVFVNEKGEKYTEFDYKMSSESLIKNKYKGSIYWKDTLTLGRFSVAGGDTVAKLVLLDLLNQQFLVHFEDNTRAITNTNLTLDGHHFVCIKGRFYEPLSVGKVKVLVHHSCVLKEYAKGYKDGLPESLDNDFRGEVVRKKDFYLLFPNHKLRPIQLTDYSVSLALVRHYESIEWHIEQFGKKINNEADVIQLLHFLEVRGVF
ncbi:hypothetical protein P1X15_18860 [Runella sp. MFBS21]|uniref:hypothetical protein n=1 Tax=Runella sp. MFBS21 TaxID=3034018 RepID=UPI0023F77963|nr:hypothetical protein [Runella sp. MFBS21]MDF7819688.1 hypothetical protein [Runella sp. MFBS21]